MAGDSAGRATAYWTVGPGVGELREEALPTPRGNEALVRTLHSGISRGTELLVHRGEVPSAVEARMRAPFQAGDFPFPVKYGYLSVGVVEQGPPTWVGRTVFCLHPHQDSYVVPVTSLTTVPAEIPPRRALLAGAVETAVNAVWDAAPRLGDRVAVVGAGLIGAAVAAVLRTFPLARLEIVDPARAALAAALGIPFRTPAEAGRECDLVVHATATGSGLDTALALLGDEGEVVELSWFGSAATTVHLGADFHARRLSIRASQVGVVSPSRRTRRTTADRLGIAVDLLRDPTYDALLNSSVTFAELPETMRRLADGELTGGLVVVDYPPTNTES